MVVGITIVVTRLIHYRTIFDWLLQMSYSTFVSWKLIATAVFAFSSIVPLVSAGKFSPITYMYMLYVNLGLSQKAACKVASLVKMFSKTQHLHCILATRLDVD